MIRLLIVDDEKITRDSLKLYIPWEEIGIDEVETAKNGLIALELAKELNPDIVLCDVRMPKMDGIEFAKRLREFNQNCKIIFLSAYADKEYLISAISLRAVSYVEKPIQMNELTKLLKDTTDLCIEEQSKKIQAIMIENKIIDSIPYMHQKLTLALINGSHGIKELDEKYGSQSLQFSVINAYTTIYIILNWKPEINIEERLLLQSNLLNSLYKYEFVESGTFFAGSMNSNSIAIIFCGDYVDNNGNHTTPFDTLLDFLLDSSQGNFTVSIGVGLLANSIADIPNSYKQAIAAANFQFYDGENKVFYLNESTYSRKQVNRETLKEFKNLLRKNSSAEACKLVETLTSELMMWHEPDLNYIRDIYFKLLVTIFEVSRENNLLIPKDEEESKYIWQEIAAINTLNGILTYITSNIKSIFEKEKSEVHLNGKIDKIIKYIKANYNDKNLSVQNIANNVYLSHTYLCAYFKKATGKTINEYITEIRLENAKEFLKSSNMKLYEIAINIGLTDPNYFCSIFKKNTGLTPSEYRERYNNNENNYS
jgi:two-component system response regulator YesN